jgi:hypothetical protein
MVMKKSFFCILILFIYLACYPEEEVKDSPPDRVILVEKTVYADTLENEPGIDAEASLIADAPNTIQLMWRRHTQASKLSHYNIYRRDTTAVPFIFDLLDMKDVDPLNLNDTIYIDTKDLIKNIRYSYFVTAVDKNDLESSHSDTVSYMLIEKAIDLFLNNHTAPVISSPELLFKWSVEGGQTPDNYFLRIERNIGHSFFPLVYVKEIQSTFQTPQPYSVKGDWIKQKFENGEYRWRIDCVGSDLFSGAESDWSSFTVSWSSL